MYWPGPTKICTFVVMYKFFLSILFCVYLQPTITLGRVLTLPGKKELFLNILR